MDVVTNLDRSFLEAKPFSAGRCVCRVRQMQVEACRTPAGSWRPPPYQLCHPPLRLCSLPR